ncbi:MAG TPA: PEGA domain-containing protein, partial [Methylomirabilota bacterium]|nr:PEGA domain-containing protein [Methylomirabilota bacterium]
PAPVPPVPSARVEPRPERVAPPRQESRPAPPVTTSPALPVPPASAAARTGFLRVNSAPWAVLYVDGRLVGNTPQPFIQVRPGPHRLRLVRDGFRPLDVAVVVRPGDTLRVTDLVLEEIRP